MTACQRTIDYYDYVSTLRSNILLYEDENFSLRIYAMQVESPNAIDGIKGECVSRMEIRLLAPSGEQECHIRFTIDGIEYQGECSFDNVKTEYFYACPLDVSSCKSIPMHILYGSQTIDCTAQSIVQKNMLTPKAALQAIVQAEGKLFTDLTDKYGFAGEIHIRLLYEDAPYYYIGIIDRNKNTTAFLINALSGKILARRNV